MYSIGYKLKFDNVESEDIRVILDEYLRDFDRYEIKFSKTLLSSGKMELLLEFSERFAKGKYSLHVLKDVLNNSESYNILVDLIQILKRFEISEEVYLITHIPFGNVKDYFNKILEISRSLPEKCILLLENELIDSNNEEYLKQINDMCKYLAHSNIDNVGICLDIGHLLYGFSKENISTKDALKKLQERLFVLPSIKEIHIHDYLEKDHLKINDGIMELALVSEFIKKNELTVPIIIEASVALPDEGIKQLEILKQYFKNE